MDDPANRFIDMLRSYVGDQYLLAAQIVIDTDTRFEQLNFDLCDEVIAERMIADCYGLPKVKIDSWPKTVGQLIRKVSKKAQTDVLV